MLMTKERRPKEASDPKITDQCLCGPPALAAAPPPDPGRNEPGGGGEPRRPQVDRAPIRLNRAFCSSSSEP